MKWYEHAHNPQALTSMFSVAPALEKVRVLGLNLCPRNREATAHFELPEFPSKPPQKWAGKGFTVAQVQMDFFCVGSLEVSGWESDEIISIQIERASDDKLTFNAKGSRCRIHFAFASFRIASVVGYDSGRTEESEQMGHAASQ